MATRKIGVPPDVLEKLERIARARRSTADDVAAALLRRSLGDAAFVPGNGRQYAEAWKRAFAPLTEEEMLVVDGILMGPIEA